jgi:myosin heavy subunit
MNPKPSDEKFLETLHRKHNKNSHFPRLYPKDMQHIFIVRHFAVSVSYTICAFIDTNNDTIQSDKTQLFAVSSNPLAVAGLNDENEEVSRPGMKTLMRSVPAKFSK